MLLSLFVLKNLQGNQYNFFFISMFLLLFYSAIDFFLKLFYSIIEYEMLHTYILQLVMVVDKWKMQL